MFPPAMAMATGYQPLNVWHAYETSLRLCFRHAGHLVMAVALAIVPSQAIFLILQSATVPDALLDDFGRSPFDTTPEELDIPSSEMASWIAGNLLGAFASGIGLVLATAVACVVIAEAWHGRDASWRSAWGRVGRRFGSLIWLMVVWGLLVFIGILLCVLPGIWLLVAWSVSIPALVFEDARGSRALERSFRLTRRRWWPTFGGLLLIVTTGWLIATPLIVPGFFVGAMTDDFFIGSSLQGTLNILGNLITTPITASIVTIFFFDLRARNEIAAMQPIPPPRAPVAPPPPPAPPPLP